MVRWLVASWAGNAIVLGLVGWILSAVTFHGSTWTVIWSALVFGILNTVLKPVLKLLTLPLAFLTLGLAWLFVAKGMLASFVRYEPHPFRPPGRAPDE